MSSVRPRQASLTSQMAARALNTSQYSEPSTSLSPLCHDTPSLPLQIKTSVSMLVVDISQNNQSYLQIFPAKNYSILWCGFHQ